MPELSRGTAIVSAAIEQEDACAQRRVWPHVIACAGAALLASVYLYLRYPTLKGLLRSLGVGHTPLHDFQAFFYPMGRSLLDGASPVDGFLYTPLAALLFVPLGQLPYATAAAIWTALLLSLVAVLAGFSVGRDVIASCLGVTLSIASVPVLHDLKFGQVSLLIVVALLACGVCYRRGHVRAAAACLAFAASLKLYPLLFALHFVFRRDLRALVATGVFLLIGLLLVPVVMLGVESTFGFYSNVAGQLDARFFDPIADINSQSLRSLLDRWAAGAAPAVRLALDGARYAICGALLVVSYRMARRTDATATQHAFMWLFLCTPFFVATSWPHYFVYLPPVVTAILAEARTLPRRTAARSVAMLGAGGAALLSSMFFFDLVHDRKLYVRSGVLFYANLLAMLAFIAVTVAGRPHRSGGVSAGAAPRRALAV
jgi:hypothetical protein